MPSIKYDTLKWPEGSSEFRKFPVIVAVNDYCFVLESTVGIAVIISSSSNQLRALKSDPNNSGDWEDEEREKAEVP